MFSPEDKLRKVLVRVVEDLPYGLIIAEAFLKMHGSSISFAAGGGFEPAPELTCMRVISSTGDFNSKAVEFAVGVATSPTDGGAGFRKRGVGRVCQGSATP